MKKLDISKLRNLEKKKQERKGANDPRFLNYFDLAKDETMTIRLLPDGGDSGSYYVEYALHGEGFDDPKVSTIPCSNNHGERCPACAKSYALYKDDLEEEAKPWRKRTKFIAQCVVIDSPIEIPENPDGSIIKLINLPFQMHDRALEGIMNGTVEDPFDMENGNNFIIKKTKKGKFNQYDKSYWEAKPSGIPVEILEELAKEENELHDLSTFIPEGGSPDEVEEWIKKTEKTLADSVVVGGDGDNTSTRSENSNSTNSSEPEEPPKEASSSGSSNDKVKEILARMKR